MSKLQIGAQLYSIRDRCTNAADMLAALKEIKAMGYNTCQLSGQSADITPAQMKDMLDEAGLICTCTHISFEAMQDDLPSVIANHKLLGCAYPGIGGLPDKYRHSAEGFAQFAKEASAIADKLLEHGMHFLYHNHSFEFAKFPCGQTGMDILYENLAPSAQFELDMFWVQAGGASPLDWIEKVRGRMEVAHFKDMTGGKPWSMTPIGEGNLNWTKIIAACDDIGVKYALVEQDNAVESDSLACMKVSHDNLLALGARF